MSPRHAGVDEVREALTAPLERAGLDLEAVELTPAGKRRVLRVAVDKDGGVTLDELADATRAVSDVLDTSDVMGEQPYTLEVTSRGVDRPLTHPRHWRRNRDRLVRVVLSDGEVVTGRVLRSDHEESGAVVLGVEGDGGPARPDGPAERTVPYAEVGRALVQVELNRRAPAAEESHGHDEEETS